MIANGEFLQFLLLICDHFFRSFLHLLHFRSFVACIVDIARVVREPRVKTTREKHFDEKMANYELRQGDDHKQHPKKERREHDHKVSREEIKPRNVAFRLQQLNIKRENRKILVQVSNDRRPVEVQIR